MAYDPRLVAEYIRQAALQRGIDPSVALRVAQSEGLNSYVGDSGSSFGPFQLHYGGVARGGNAVGGLGDIFTKRTGLDARNPDTWRQQVDFSLDEAKRGGWGPWHGWKGAATAGIGGRPADLPASSPNKLPIDAMAYADTASAPAQKANPIGDLITQTAPKKPDPIAGLLSSLAPEQPKQLGDEEFLKQIMDLHNAQHSLSVQGLLGR